MPSFVFAISVLTYERENPKKSTSSFMLKHGIPAMSLMVSSPDPNAADDGDEKCVRDGCEENSKSTVGHCKVVTSAVSGPGPDLRSDDEDDDGDDWPRKCDCHFFSISVILFATH